MRIAVERSPCYPQEPEQTHKSRLDASALALEGKADQSSIVVAFVECLLVLVARADDWPESFPGVSSGYGVACD